MVLENFLKACGKVERSVHLPLMALRECFPRWAEQNSVWSLLKGLLGQWMY